MSRVKGPRRPMAATIEAAPVAAKTTVYAQEVSDGSIGTATTLRSVEEARTRPDLIRLDVEFFPVAQGDAPDRTDSRMAELTLTVDGMTCGHCQSAVTTALESVPGVQRAAVDLVSGTVALTVVDDIDTGALEAAVEEAGYRVGAP